MSTWLIASGLEFLGSGIRSIEGVLRDLFVSAENRITICVYSLTIASDVLTDLVEDGLKRGVEIVLIINRYSQQHSATRQWVDSLRERYPSTLKLYDFDRPDSELHAKIVIADARFVILGSSNLSKSGLMLNHELAVASDDESLVSDCLRVATRIRNKCKIVS